MSHVWSFFAVFVGYKHHVLLAVVYYVPIYVCRHSEKVMKAYLPKTLMLIEQNLFLNQYKLQYYMLARRCDTSWGSLFRGPTLRVYNKVYNIPLVWRQIWPAVDPQFWASGTLNLGKCTQSTQKRATCWFKFKYHLNVPK